MKKILTTGVASCLAILSLSTKAQTPVQPLPPFEKIIVSPQVSVVLVAGTQESIQLNYQNIEPEKLNYSVRHKTLRIYLDGARLRVKHRKNDYNGYSEPVYKGVKVTAYVTYRHLNNLQIRGEENLVCQDGLSSDRFKLRVYGQATVTLAELKTNKLKATLYGENKVTIQSGQALQQRYRLYGENQLDTRQLTGQTVSAYSYGESQLRVYASTRIGLTAFGESDLRYAGNASVHKGLVIGKVTINRTE